MEKVKVINKKTGAVKEIKKALAGDYIGTGEFEMYEEKLDKAINDGNAKFSLIMIDLNFLKKIKMTIIANTPPIIIEEMILAIDSLINEALSDTKVRVDS